MPWGSRCQGYLQGEQQERQGPQHGTPRPPGQPIERLRLTAGLGGAVGDAAGLGRRWEGRGVLKSKHWEDETQGVSCAQEEHEMDHPTSILTIGGVCLGIQRKFVFLEKVHGSSS